MSASNHSLRPDPDSECAGYDVSDVTDMLLRLTVSAREMRVIT